MSELIIQPSNADNTLRQGDPTQALGAFEFVIVSNPSGDRWRTILRFDFSSLPDGALITTATLSLYYYDQYYNPVGRIYLALELTKTDWEELESSWNNYKTGNPWTAPGGDYETQNEAQTEMPASFGWVSWDVLALTQHFQSNHSKIANFLLKDQTEGSGIFGSFFYSNNYAADHTLRPKLIIEYTTAAAYVLTAEAGSYSETGQTEALRATRRLPAAADSYAIDGKTANIRATRKITASSTSYSLTGKDALLRARRLMHAEQGLYALTGHDVTLSTIHNYRLEAEQGYYGEPYSKIILTLDGKLLKKIGNIYLPLQ